MAAGLTTSSLEPGPTRVRFQVTAWLAVAAAIAYVCRNSLAVAEKTIRGDLGITETQMGWILGPAFFWTYALAQIPTAWCVQRWGSRRCLPWVSAAWSAATAAFALSRGWLSMLVYRCVTGVAQAGVFPGATRTVADWHPATERALASGILAAAMSIGGALGAMITGAVLDPQPGWQLPLPQISWQLLFTLYAVPGLLWACGFWWWFRDFPQQHPATNEAERKLVPASQPAGRDGVTEGGHEPTPWHALATSRAMWLICGQQFFRAAGYAFFGSWFATYLQEARGISTAGSGLLTTLPLLAIVLSSVMGGGFSDYVFRTTGSLNLARKGVAATMLALCAALIVGAYYIEDSTTAVVIISVGVFCSGFAGPCGYAVTMDMGGRHVAAVFSTMNMIGNFGAGLLPWVIPHFKQFWGRQPVLLELTGGSSWAAVLFLFAATYLAAALCWMMLRVEGTVFDSPPPRKTRSAA